MQTIILANSKIIEYEIDIHLDQNIGSSLQVLPFNTFCACVNATHARQKVR